MSAFDVNVSRRFTNFKEHQFCDKITPIDIFPAGVLFCNKHSHNRPKTISADVNYVSKPILQV
jgi:hypothetical protein